VDICSMCHPFFTGQQKFIDTEGRIQKFQKKMEAAKQAPVASKKKKGKITKKSIIPVRFVPMIEKREH